MTDKETYAILKSFQKGENVFSKFPDDDIDDAFQRCLVDFEPMDQNYKVTLTENGRRFIEEYELKIAPVQSAMESNRLSHESNKIAQEANEIAVEANRIAQNANRRASIAIFISIISILLSATPLGAIIWKLLRQWIDI